MERRLALVVDQAGSRAGPPAFKQRPLLGQHECGTTEAEDKLLPAAGGPGGAPLFLPSGGGGEQKTKSSSRWCDGGRY